MESMFNLPHCLHPSHHKVEEARQSVHLPLRTYPKQEEPIIGQLKE